jgi:hypothetical protein
MTRYSVSPRGSDRSMVGLSRPILLISFRTMSLMHCSSSTAGTSVRITRSWGWLPRPYRCVRLSPDGEVFLLTSAFIDHRSAGSQVQQILKSWTYHYNQGRPHSSLGPGIPDRSSPKAEIQTESHSIPKNRRIVVTSILGGLHHEYGLAEFAA